VVAGSNPAVPTKQIKRASLVEAFLFLTSMLKNRTNINKSPYVILTSLIVRKPVVA
jgi:hypothetical protein